MGVKVLASLGTENYFTEVIAGENKLITDEPLGKIRASAAEGDITINTLFF